MDGGDSGSVGRVGGPSKGSTGQRQIPKESGDVRLRTNDPVCGRMDRRRYRETGSG